RAPASSRSVMKLLNRLTTMPKRNPAPLNSPRISLCSIFALISAPRGPSGLPLCPVVRRHRACGYALVSFTNVEVWHPGVSSGGCRAPLFPLKLCRALLAKRSSTLAHIFGGAAQPRQARRAAVTRDDAEPHFRLAELRRLAGQANRTGQRQLAASAEREAVDRGQGRFSERLELVQDALAKDGKLLAVHCVALGELVDVRTGDKGLLSRAGQDQHAHFGILARLRQQVAQLLHRFEIG